MDNPILSKAEKKILLRDGVYVKIVAGYKFTYRLGRGLEKNVQTGDNDKSRGNTRSEKSVESKVPDEKSTQKLTVTRTTAQK